jgi:hypothetical protein
MNWGPGVTPGPTTHGKTAAPANPIPCGYEPKANEPDTDTGREA